MNHFLGLVVFTSNILGSFTDPFEFEGNYGDEINPTRHYVFEQVVSKEALANNFTDFQIVELLKNHNLTTKQIQHYRKQLLSEAIQADLEHGPTLSELISPELIEQFLHKQQELQTDRFSETDLSNILDFINRYHNQKMFAFLRHAPSDFLSLDKILHDKATREGRNFDLSILSSTESLKGSNAFELKSHLLDQVFTTDSLSTVKPANTLKNAIEKLDPLFLKQYLGPDADNAELTIFTTPAGQAFFYWLYQSLNLHLISHNETMISHINHVKHVFASTLGNPHARAQLFRNKLITADASIVFTQESDAIVPQVLTKDGLFHSVAPQNPTDGTFVFLRGDHWESSYQMIAIDDYEDYARGRLNAILATQKDTGEKFFLASSHGNSTRAEDGRLQITKIVEKFHQLIQSPENKNLQLVIGIDANTKSDQDVELLRDHLQTLGLIATSTGPTTIKKRMVTVQHAKAGDMPSTKKTM